MMFSYFDFDMKFELKHEFETHIVLFLWTLICYQLFWYKYNDLIIILCFSFWANKNVSFIYYGQITCFLLEFVDFFPTFGLKI